MDNSAEKPTKESEEKPDIFPIRVNDVDRLHALLASETVKRTHSQLELAQIRLDQAKAESEKAQNQEQTTLQDIWKKYYMGQQDHFDMSSGLITRAEIPKKP